MTVNLWLVAALMLSGSINLILMWFSREQSRSLVYISENLGDLVEIIANYKKHLRKVYSLEMFYGDENLKHLMDHTTAVVSVLQEEYGDITSITDPLEVIFEEEEGNEEEEEIRQDVFYGGPRERHS